MKKMFLISTVVVVIIILWQGIDFILEPQIIEVLPVKISKIPSIDPYYPEPVRVVFDKEVEINKITYSINPNDDLKAQTRRVHLRNKQITIEFPAFVLNNENGLQPNTLYNIEVHVKKRNIFDYVFPKRTSIQFKTTGIDKSLPKETGSDLDKRLGK